MAEENISQYFRLKNIDETRLILEEIKQNELMSKKHKKVCTTLNYTEHFLILASTITHCWTWSTFGDIIYSCYCKRRLVTPLMVRAEGTRIFDFDNPRLLEKALLGKELHWKLLLLTKKYWKY